MDVIKAMARAFFRIGQRIGQMPIAQARIGGGAGSAPGNTTNVVGTGATTPDVVAANSVNDMVQVGA